MRVTHCPSNVEAAQLGREKSQFTARIDFGVTFSVNTSQTLLDGFRKIIGNDRGNYGQCPIRRRLACFSNFSSKQILMIELLPII